MVKLVYFIAVLCLVMHVQSHKESDNWAPVNWKGKADEGIKVISTKERKWLQNKPPLSAISRKLPQLCPEVKCNNGRDECDAAGCECEYNTFVGLYCKVPGTK